MFSSRLVARATICGAAGLLCASPLHAQEKVSPAAAFREARALYYTPVDKGLEGFDCDVTFNWKQFMQQATNAPVEDTDERLKYLDSVKLTVSDDLKGTGELHWTAPAPPPDANETSISQIRGGIQQMWSGFFQSWNGFYNGDLVSLDEKATVERTPTGYHVFARNNGQVAEETYGGDFTMQSLHVSTPQFDSVMTPAFERTPQGRVVTELDSVLKQPPTAPGLSIDMTVHYAPANGFQLPSELLIKVANAGSFDFHLSGCTVRLKVSAPKPASASPPR